MAAEGRPAQSHSETCRKIMERLLREEGNSRVKKADERMKTNEEGAARERDQEARGNVRARIEEETRPR